MTASQEHGEVAGEAPVGQDTFLDQDLDRLVVVIQAQVTLPLTPE